MDESLRKELLEMAAEDQTVFGALQQAYATSAEGRAEIEARSAAGSSSPTWALEWREEAPAPIIHVQDVVRRNTDRMRRIVGERGWPGHALVGTDGPAAAWLLVHHADDLSFQRDCLPLLERAVGSDDATEDQLQWLTDRVLLREGKEERHGTHAGRRGPPPSIPSPPR